MKGPEGGDAVLELVGLLPPLCPPGRSRDLTLLRVHRSDLTHTHVDTHMHIDTHPYTDTHTYTQTHTHP